MASFGIQQFDPIGIKLVINQNFNKILKNFLPILSKKLNSNNNINTYNSSFNSLLIFKNMDKFFDLFENQFKALNQFGCKFVLTTTAKNNLHNILYLSLLNHRQK